MKACGMLVLFLRVRWLRGRMTTRSHCRNWFQGAQQWAQENLDTNVLNALPEVDERAVQQFFREVQQRFQGTTWWIWRHCGKRPKPSCRCWKAVRKPSPTPSWLKAQMDYLEVADEIRLTIPPPNVETNQPPQPVPNPRRQKRT